MSLLKNNAAENSENNLPGVDITETLSMKKRFTEWLITVLSGILLSCAYPPFELDILIWIALIPLMLMIRPRAKWRTIFLGYSFGYAHYATSLLWLNEVGFGAGFLMALPCALFPMFWFMAASSFCNRIGPKIAPPGQEPAAKKVTISTKQRLLQYGTPVLVLPMLWVSFEWIRSWILTGFPWNQLGISLWQQTALISSCAWFGVYGLSFLIAAVNTSIFCSIRIIQKQTKINLRSIWIPLPFLILTATPFVLIALTRQPLQKPDHEFHAALIQGNIPQCRVYTQEQFQEALEIYSTLSTQVVKGAGKAGLPLDLIVWPETAIPAPLDSSTFAYPLLLLRNELATPLLIGAVERRIKPGAEPPYAEEQVQLFNTAVYYNKNGKRIENYDKIHLVPFGEFTPLGEHLPWLVELIGMGRDLIPGKDYTIFNFTENARAGVNICFEDVFPEISRHFVLNGATILITLTNDAWYAESAGSRQHMIHAIFRAVENQRPLLRSGNNSDSCLILPDGTVFGRMYDPKTGTPFVRDFNVYPVPVWNNLPTTFYTKYGNIFAWACTFISMLLWLIDITHKTQERNAFTNSLKKQQ